MWYIFFQFIILLAVLFWFNIWLNNYMKHENNHYFRLYKNECCFNQNSYLKVSITPSDKHHIFAKYNINIPSCPNRYVSVW